MYIVDRFEENFAVLEYTDEAGNVSITKVSKDNLAQNAEEGNVVYFENGVYYTDVTATKQRRKKVFERLNSIKERKC